MKWLDTEVFVVTYQSNNDNKPKISSECYNTAEKAIKFIENKLSYEEIRNHQVQLENNEISWYEYPTNDGIYKITVLNLV